MDSREEKDCLSPDPLYRSYRKRWLVLSVVVLLNVTEAMVSVFASMSVVTRGRLRLGDYRKQKTKRFGANGFHKKATLAIIATCRGVTRLDGARGKKQVWHPHVRTWGLSKANLLYWRKYLRHCWDFLAPVAVIPCPLQWFGAPIVIRCPGYCALFEPPSLRPWQHDNFSWTRFLFEFICLRCFFITVNPFKNVQALFKTHVVPNDALFKNTCRFYWSTLQQSCILTRWPMFPAVDEVKFRLILQGTKKPPQKLLNCMAITSQFVGLIISSW